jgi:hypothetical protein
VAWSALLAAQGGELLFDLLETPKQGVALGGDRRELALVTRRPLILLGDPVLELGFPLVELFELGLEPGDALLGRKVADEQHVDDQQHEPDAREHEEPGNSRVRPVDHGLGF